MRDIIVPIIVTILTAIALLYVTLGAMFSGVLGPGLFGMRAGVGGTISFIVLVGVILFIAYKLLRANITRK